MTKDSQTKIALLGATGHIGKNVLVGLKSVASYHIYAFSRSTESLQSFIDREGFNNQTTVLDYSDFEDHQYNVIINCIGIGDPQNLLINPSNVFFITEKYDNLILRYLEKNPTALYINLSSGAAYGNSFSQPASSESKIDLKPNQLNTSDFYGIAKLNMEAKHRGLSNLYIVDLRIFGFFSAYIWVNARFFLTDIVRALYDKGTLETTNEDMIRDYVHPNDLIQLIIQCMEQRELNMSLDVYSKAPVSKFEILDFFESHHGLIYKVLGSKKAVTSVTGSKPNYYSLYTKANELGYSPSYTSLECISEQYSLLQKRLLNE